MLRESGVPNIFGQPLMMLPFSVPVIIFGVTLLKFFQDAGGKPFVLGPIDI
jgi:ABC-type spermidine/putrescine transport system permease subunit II